MSWLSSPQRSEPTNSGNREVWLGGDGPRPLGTLTFDPASGELFGPVESTRLRPQIARLLDAFSARPGHLFTRKKLHGIMWPNSRVEYDAGLNNCILELRKALSQDPDVSLETIPRRGYRLNTPATERAVDEVRDREETRFASHALGQVRTGWVRSWVAVAGAILLTLVAVGLMWQDANVQVIDLIVLHSDLGSTDADSLEADLEVVLSRAIREQSTYSLGSVSHAWLGWMPSAFSDASVQVIASVHPNLASVTMQLIDPTTRRSMAAVRLDASTWEGTGPTQAAFDWLSISLVDLERIRGSNPDRPPRPAARDSYLSAMALLNAGRFEESVPNFMRAIRADAWSGAVGRGLLEALSRSVYAVQPDGQRRLRYDTLVQYAEMVASAIPNHPKANLVLAEDAAFRHGDAASARAFVATALAGHSQALPSDLVDAARILVSIAEHATATELLDAVAESDHLSLDSMRGMAAVRLRLGDWKTARDICQPLVNGRIDIPWAQVCLVRSALHVGQEELARDAASAIMRRQGHDPNEDGPDALQLFWDWMLERSFSSTPVGRDETELGTFGILASAGRFESLMKTIDQRTFLRSGLLANIQRSASYAAFRADPGYSFELPAIPIDEGNARQLSGLNPLGTGIR